MKVRIQGIDFCKAIGIYLVVLGHFLPVGTPLKVIIYSFHVPLFFILSGFLLRTERKWFSQILRRARSLLLPYFGFAAISLIYYIFIPMSKIEILKKFLFLNGETIWNEPLWFLFTLFVVELIAYTIFRCLPIFAKNTTALIILTALVLIIGYFVYYFRPAPLTFLGLDKAICLLGFYLFGYLLNKLKLFDLFSKAKGIWAGVLVTVCAVALIFNWNNNISVYYLDLNNYFVFLFTAIVGSTCVIYLCLHVKINSFMQSVSKHTIFIMGTHYAFLLLYIWLAKKLPIDSMLFCLPVLAIYTVVLYWWDKRRALNFKK